jgi:hypothetical protein
VFRDVPLGKTIYGYAGLTYLLTRDGAGTPVELGVTVDGAPIGKLVHDDKTGWEHFEFATGQPREAGDRAATSEVAFEVKSASPRHRGFCFYADSR